MFAVTRFLLICSFVLLIGCGPSASWGVDDAISHALNEVGNTQSSVVGVAQWCSQHGYFDNASTEEEVIEAARSCVSWHFSPAEESPAETGYETEASSNSFYYSLEYGCEALLAEAGVEAAKKDPDCAPYLPEEAPKKKKK